MYDYMLCIFFHFCLYICFEFLLLVAVIWNREPWCVFSKLIISSNYFPYVPSFSSAFKWESPAFLVILHEGSFSVDVSYFIYFSFSWKAPDMSWILWWIPPQSSGRMFFLLVQSCYWLWLLFCPCDLSALTCLWTALPDISLMPFFQYVCSPICMYACHSYALCALLYILGFYISKTEFGTIPSTCKSLLELCFYE